MYNSNDNHKNGKSDALLNITNKLTSADGTIKYIFKTIAGHALEAVYLPAIPERKIPYSFCISSQCGCAMNCKFCATGYGGFNANLSSTEMLQEVILIREDILKNKIEQKTTPFITALMGMGEPLMNAAETIDFCYKIKDLDLPLVKTSISTIGIPKKIKALADLPLSLNICLYLSLHSPTRAERSIIMPGTKPFSLTETIKTCKSFVNQHEGKVRASYLLLENFNDSTKHAKKLVKLLDPNYFEIKILLYNPSPTMPFSRTPDDKVKQFQNILSTAGFKAIVQPSNGCDIHGGCGQFLTKQQSAVRTNKQANKRKVKMQYCYDLVVINPYAETDYSIHTRKNVNVGILSLASYIERKGYRTKILDFGSDKHYITKLYAFLKDNPTKVIAVSSTSCFSYRTLKQTVTEITLPYKHVLILGGQMVIGLGKRLFDELPQLKYAGFNEGESTLLHILENFDKDISKAPGLAFRDGDSIIYNPPRALSFDELGPLNYELYPDYINLIPTVEESRGCPFKCNFCANDILKFKVRIKNWKQFIQEVLDVYTLYKKKKIFFNIGCSTFGMDEKNAINILKALIPHKDKFLIQVWTRCDTEYENWIPILKQLDISSVFFGMETASVEMLTNMRKSSDPKGYLERSQRLIDAFYENNLKLWCNFIFGYIGERPDTIEETINFILNNKNKIGFLSGHGLISFPGSQVYEEFEMLQKKYGASYAVKGSLPELLHYKVNPSFDFTFEQVSAIAQVLIKIVNSKEDFKEVYAWKWLGQEEDATDLDDRTSYLKPHELPYRYNAADEHK